MSFSSTPQSDLNCAWMDTRAAEVKELSRDKGMPLTFLWATTGDAHKRCRNHDESSVRLLFSTDDASQSSACMHSLSARCAFPQSTGRGKIRRRAGIRHPRKNSEFLPDDCQNCNPNQILRPNSRYHRGPTGLMHPRRLAITNLVKLKAVLHSWS